MAIKVRLNVIEPLGNDMDVYMSTSVHEHVVGRLEAQTGLQAGEWKRRCTSIFAKLTFLNPERPG